jgi:hypothetical protein
MLTKFVLEIENQAVNLVNQELRRPHDWLGFNHVRLADGYLKGDLHILVFFRVAREEWLADFQTFPVVGGGEERDGEVEAVPATGDDNVAEADKGREQRLMLVGNVQFVEYPEEVSLPSLVRFGAPNQVLRGLPHSLYLSSKRGFVNTVSFGDGEHGLFANTITRDLDKLTGEMVKGASEVVDDVSGSEGDVGVNLVKRCGEETVKSLMPRLRVWLAADGVRLALDEPILDCFEIVEVCLGPFDFSTDEGDSFVGGHKDLP